MPTLPPSTLLVRTADGSTVRLKSIAVLRTWVASGRLNPQDRVLGTDGRWHPVARGVEELDLRGASSTPRIASQRLATRPIGQPDLTVAAPVYLGFPKAP